MIDFAREMIAAQTHRKTVDPIVWAKRKTPFVIERVGLSATDAQLLAIAGRVR